MRQQASAMRQRERTGFESVAGIHNYSGYIESRTLHPGQYYQHSQRRKRIAASFPCQLPCGLDSECAECANHVWSLDDPISRDQSDPS